MSGEVERNDQAPWARGDLRITEAVRAAIHEEARRAYPSEACGFVMGPATDVALLDEFAAEANEADKYHKLDPERFPRTSREYFKMNELRATRRFAEQKERGHPVKVIFHSHCDAGAYFSAEDTQTFSQNGELMWPCAYLVVSVMGGEVVDEKLWVHVPGEDRFVASALQVVPE